MKRHIITLSLIASLFLSGFPYKIKRDCFLPGFIASPAIEEYSEPEDEKIVVIQSSEVEVGFFFIDFLKSLF